MHRRGPWALWLCLAARVAAAAPLDQEAQAIAASARGAQALIVVVGRPAPAWPAVLSGGRHLVQTLVPASSPTGDADSPAEQAADAIRQAARLAGMPGRVTAMTVPWQSGLAPRLPYADRTVNVLVWRDAGRCSVAESLRVVQPEGAIWIHAASPELVDQLKADARTETVRQSGPWTSVFVSRPAALDSWPHGRHGADRNAVSRDALVTPPQQLRWAGGERWPRGFRRSAVPAINVGTRQLVYILQDEAPEHGQLVRRNSLVARDAFNGLPLWRVPAQSDLIATLDERVYTAQNGGAVELDARTGKLLRQFATGSPAELAVSGDRLIVQGEHELSVWNRTDGRRRWELSRHVNRFVADEQTLYVLEDHLRRGGEATVSAFDLASGEPRWQTTPAWAGAPAQLVLVAEGVVILADREGNLALDARDGSLLWRYRYDLIGHGGSYEKVLVADGLVWVHVARSGGHEWRGLDPRTGKVRHEVRQPADYHLKHRCSFDVATGKWLMCGTMDFASLSTGEHRHFAGARNSCSSAGLVPANGLVYTFPHACGCYPMLRGMLALAGADSAETSAAGANGGDSGGDTELVRGSARPADTERAQPADFVEPAGWWTYRGDGRRRGVASRGPQAMRVLWRHELDRQLSSAAAVSLPHEWSLRDSPSLSPPSHAPDRCFVCDAEHHRLLALDAASGNVVWEYLAESRIEGPPSVVGGWCLFGTRGGWAHCVRADDGKLSWRRRLTDEPWIVSHGQLESASPVRGPSLVSLQAGCWITGRHQDVGKGLWAHAVEMDSGRLRWRQRADGHAGVPDVLAGQGGQLQMGSWRATLPATVDDRAKAASESAGSPWRQLIRGGKLGVLDDSWYRRPIAMRKDLQQWSTESSLMPLEGQLICFDDRRGFSYEASERVVGLNGLMLGSARLRGQIAGQPAWEVQLANSSRISGMVLAGDSLYVAGEFKASLLGRSATQLRRYQASSGKLLETLDLPARPVHDGMSCDGGRLFVSLVNREVMAVGER